MGCCFGTNGASGNESVEVEKIGLLCPRIMKEKHDEHVFPRKKLDELFERSPLLTDTSSPNTYQTQGQVYDTVIIEVPPAECPTVENTSSSFKFIPIDQNTNQAKDHKDRSAFYREKFGSYLRDAKVPQVLPNVIDPTTVLLLPCTGKEELDQVNQSSRTIANLIEQMKPKSKEPITAVTLD